LSCDAPLLKEPPRNLAELYSSVVNPSKIPQSKQEALLYSSVVNPSKIPQSKQEAFMVSNDIRDLNKSAVYYKAQHCKSANFEYNLTLKRNWFFRVCKCFRNFWINVVSYRPNFERAKSASSASSTGPQPPNQPKIPPPPATVCSAAASVSFDDLSSLLVCSSLSFEISAV
jgi:hypothetical protein